MPSLIFNMSNFSLCKALTNPDWFVLILELDGKKINHLLLFKCNAFFEQVSKCRFKRVMLLDAKIER